MGEWDNYCDEIGGICKDMEAQAVRIAELEDTVRKLTVRERILGDETILYAAHKETIAYKDKQIAELEKELEQMRTVALGYCELARRLQESLDESERYWDKALVEARKLTENVERKTR